jgi:tetratricopeptide (TPR) repeat protein
MQVSSHDVYHLSLQPQMLAAIREELFSMPTYHQGISPTLVSLLTDTSEQLLPERLTVSMLPGRITNKIARKSKEISPRNPVNKHMLTCLSCGRKGQYDMGKVIVHRDIWKTGNNEPADAVQCTGYFRCKHCNSADGWEMPGDFNFFLFSGVLEKLAVGSSRQMQFGIIQLFDGYEPKWATDGEHHIFQRMRTEGQSGFLWNRLGNLYRSGGRPELAAAAFEQSLRLDSTQLESYISLGDMLHEIDECEDAAYYFRKALVHARTYDRLERPRLLDMLAATIQHLFWIHMDQTEIAFLPTHDEYGDPVMNLSDQRTIELRDFSLRPDDWQSFYPVAEMYLGVQQAAAGNHHGQPITSQKVGRNEPCPCGSGLKYKKCCGR